MRTCPFCGVDFIPTTKRQGKTQRTCGSSNCKSLARGDDCSACGKRVHRGKGSRERIVCRDCQRAGRGDRRVGGYPAGSQWQCEWCDTAFTLAYNRRSGKPRFCSQSCASHYSNASKPAGMKAVRVCEACGKGFRPNHSKGQRFCSRDCRHSKARQSRKSATRPVVIKSCAFCGADFIKVGPRKFCGSQCAKASAAATAAARAKAKPKKPRRLFQLRCWICGAGMSSPHPGKRYCSSSCTRKAHGRGHKDRARKHGVEYVAVNPFDIYDRDGWVCQLCGDPVSPETRWPDLMCASLDHIIPISEKGPHRPDNLRLAHWLCNSYRGVDDIDFMVA